MPSTNTGLASASMYERYFVYSAEEESLKIKIHGADASFGEVLVRGVLKRYTSILTSMDNAKPDALLLIKGDLRKIKYTQPTRI